MVGFGLCQWVSVRYWVFRWADRRGLSFGDLRVLCLICDIGTGIAAEERKKRGEEK